MGKLFDNSGKNTENEIYDTSHRQYWAPPGNVAWKDNLIGFFGIVLSIILVMLFDCFVLHPIPAPKGTYDIQQANRAPFVLADSGCEYADAKILSSHTNSSVGEVYLVEQNGEVHLLVFSTSVLYTRKITDDLLVTSTETQRLRAGGFPCYYNLTIENGRKLTDISCLNAGSSKITMTLYGVIGFAIALLGSFTLQKIKKIKNNC